MDGVAIARGSHRTLLKWHRLRRRRDDLPFTAARLVEGLRLGASMEVDIRCYDGGGFACMHDATLDRETTGRGPLRRVSAEMLRGLRARAPDGSVSEHGIMLLADLVGLTSLDCEATVQLDCKEPHAGLTEAAIVGFARALAPCAACFVLSGQHLDAVTALASGVDGLRIGYDPCVTPHAMALRKEADFVRFADFVVTEAPRASTIYLALPVILRAREHGVDIVGALHQHGKLVDAYTLNPSHSGFLRALDVLMDCKVDQITTDEPLAIEAIWNACLL